MYMSYHLAHPTSGSVGSDMVPAFCPFLLSSGLCLGWLTRAHNSELGAPLGSVIKGGEGCQWTARCRRLTRAPPASVPGPLPKPSLQALPHSLVPLEKPVTILCQGPPDVDLYRLEKLRSGMYENEAVLFIPAMKQSFAGRYRCSYQNGSRWSPPSDQLELVATGNGTGGGGVPLDGRPQCYRVLSSRLKEDENGDDDDSKWLGGGARGGQKGFWPGVLKLGEVPKKLLRHQG